MKGSKEMKNIIIGVLIIALICAGVLGASCLVPDKGAKQDEVPEVSEVDYPSGDTTPEHMAEVLGSYSRYEELRDSKLRKPTKDSMQIVYDTYGAEQRKIAWVSLVMRGEVVKIEERVITIANEGDAISLYVPEFADIYTHKDMGVTKDGEEIWLGEKLKVGDLFPQGAETKFEHLKVGDWLWHISVVINADDTQARVINVVGISP